MAAVTSAATPPSGAGGRPCSASTPTSPQIEEVRDLGDVTIAQHYYRGEGIESGAQMEQRQWFVTR